MLLFLPIMLETLQMFFGSAADVRTSGWLKHASDFVVTCHSNFFTLRGGRFIPNTAITTWKPEVWAGLSQNRRTTSKALRGRLTAAIKPSPAHTCAAVVDKTCGRRWAPASDFTHQALSGWKLRGFASICAQRCCMRRRMLNEDSRSLTVDSRCLGSYIPELHIR